MTFKDRKLDKIGLGGPDSSKQIPTDTNALLGTKSSFGLGKSDASRQAKDSIKTGFNPTKKNGILGSTIVEGTVARIEQLLEESKRLIQEARTTNVNINSVSTGAGGAAGGGKGIPPNNQSDKLLSSYKSAVDTKLDNDRARDNNNTNNASQIDPGTGMTAREQTIGLTQPATDTNANTNMASEQRKQQQWENQQQQEQE